MIPIVTSCNADYLVGAKALYRSWYRNSRKGFEFWVLLDGDEELAEHAEEIMPLAQVLLNPVDERDFPTSHKWPESVPSMYWRMWIPVLFEDYGRAVYIDADALILKDMAPLATANLHGHPIGATKDKTMDVSTKGLPPELARKHTFCSSMFVFDVGAYLEKDVLGRCLDVMERDDLTFDCAVQGVMQVALVDDWQEFPYKWQAHAGHGTLCDESFVLHFMGTNPWNDFPPGVDGQKPHKIRARNIWKTYA